MAKRLTIVSILGFISLVAGLGCSGGSQDGEMPANDPIIGKPADTTAKDTSGQAARGDGGSKPGAPTKGGM